MPKLSAGLLLYRRNGDDVQVLIAHPGGPIWSRRDIGAWSLPKGALIDGEAPYDAARREFQEETGSPVNGEFTELTPLKQASGKVVHAWAVEGDIDASSVRSNLFPMEWPPRSGKMQEFPEVDLGGWFTLDIAREKMLNGQRAFLDQLERRRNEAGNRRN